MASLKCTICNEEYENSEDSEKTPKILICGHTFCSKCIKEKMVNKDNKIICLTDGKIDERPFDQISCNKIVFDILLQKEEDNKKYKVIKNEIKEKCDITLNIGMIGAQYVGKTTLSICYQNGKPFEDPNLYKPTVSLDFFSRTVKKDGKKIWIRIWDTTGQERFNSITSGYLKGLHGCFIVFDVTDRSSFEKLDMWIQFYNEFNSFKKQIMIILGNKVDKENRKVTKEEATEYARLKDIPYFGTSAKNLENIDKAFETMITEILEEQDKNSFSRKSSKIDLNDIDEDPATSKGCC